MNGKEPLIVDCTNAYTYPTVISSTRLGFDPDKVTSNFARAKSAYQHNQG